VNGVEVTLAARSPERLKCAADDVDASRTKAFGVTNFTLVEQFFADLPGPVELAPIRDNLIADGFVDTSLSASLLGDQLEAPRMELRTTLPIGRAVESADAAALPIHLMTDTAPTGATYDIDGGRQLLSGGAGSE
jgi:hypothetical protein